MPSIAVIGMTHASTGDRARYIGKNSDKNAEKTSIRSCRLAGTV
jgi:hypothetical protein